MRDVTLANRGDVHLICLGPLTNVARTLTKYPEVASALGSITMMGSSTFPWAEWNTRCDPEALRCVLDSRVPLRIVGLNVTLLCTLPRSDLNLLLHSASPRLQLLARCTQLWQRGYARKLPILHDPLAVASVACPALVSTVPARFGNLRGGQLRGWSVAWPWPDGSAQVALHVRRRRFLEFFRERVQLPSFPSFMD